MCLEKLFHDEIKDLAYRFYIGRGQDRGSALEDWLKAKRTIFLRFGFGLIYLLIGFFLVFFATPLVKYYLYFYGIEIYWCIGWSMIGAGAGLINTRNQPQSGVLHLLVYWVFIILVVSIISFTISLYKAGNIYSVLNIKFYSLSALIGIIGGFLGYIFHDLILKILVVLGKYKP
ncbi:MAG: DUF2934 domain-containing protein [Candidatus Omnitrophica bacterium]|nr:DUF2934 domain-containing protein [Candidatus Omnitrophota bacterium]